VRTDETDHQRVAVGRGARSGERRNNAASTALVLDDHRLTDGPRQPLGDRAGDEIDTAAGSEGAMILIVLFG
jgi:hypothetical protein